MEIKKNRFISDLTQQEYNKTDHKSNLTKELLIMDFTGVKTGPSIELRREFVCLPRTSVGAQLIKIRVNKTKKIYLRVLETPEPKEPTRFTIIYILLKYFILGEII
jgi:hypothetical protein